MVDLNNELREILVFHDVMNGPMAIAQITQAFKDAGWREPMSAERRDELNEQTQQDIDGDEGVLRTEEET